MQNINPAPFLLNYTRKKYILFSPQHIENKSLHQLLRGNKMEYLSASLNSHTHTLEYIREVSWFYKIFCTDFLPTSNNHDMITIWKEIKCALTLSILIKEKGFYFSNNLFVSWKQEMWVLLWELWKNGLKSIPYLLSIVESTIVQLYISCRIALR